MTRSEVIKQLTAQSRVNHFFIKSWEAGHTFVDIDLIERFIRKSGPERDFEGFELLDMEQMWQTLTELDPDKLTRVKREGSEVVEWGWKDSNGIEKKSVYPFTPGGIMTLIDDDFFA